ncbi:MAG: hypothetical protein SWX82_32090 [Cyanobacteriota bacterium]|nr:hypothetical protein [Cyanobacteriota bacterium]
MISYPIQLLKKFSITNAIAKSFSPLLPYSQRYKNGQDAHSTLPYSPTPLLPYSPTALLPYTRFSNALFFILLISSNYFLY